ncbi:MAG: FHA domain-containing protein [Planctomycetota bacterium]|jgi:pSer/pThr/pTyr-binding forkhead associated (FHA) protein
MLRYTLPGKGTMKFELEKELTLIGRSKEADIFLDDPMSSRRQCEVHKRAGGGYILVDLGSKNGTYVNGSAVSTWSLTDGDLISIGETTIMFRLHE